MLKFKILVLFSLPLIVQSYYLKSTPKAKTTKLVIHRPHQDRDFTNRVIIPNESFCNKMSLDSARFYMVMPWWYHYCENMKDKAKKNMSEKDRDRFRMLKPYQHILDKVVRYKKKQKQLKNIVANLELINN